ncbi:unnamed protein product [Ectocarpus sp. 12 AP-2014]
MSAPMVGLVFIVLALLGSPVCSTTVTESCTDGAAVESLTIWDGNWLDQLGVNCTDGSERDLIPPGATGGSSTSGVCAGSGDVVGGVESIAWYQGNAMNSLAGYEPVVYLSITCLDGDTLTFADAVAFDAWFPDSSGEAIVQSCAEGEYVAGFSAEVEYLDFSSDYTYNEFAVLDYAITSIVLDCSSSGVTPAPTLAVSPAPVTAPAPTLAKSPAPVTTPAPTLAATTGQEEAGTDTPVGATVGGVLGGALVLVGLILLALCKTGRIRTGKQRGRSPSPARAAGTHYPMARQYPQPIE